MAAGEGDRSHYVLDHFIAVPVPGLRTATLLAFDSADRDNAIWIGFTDQGLFRLDSHSVQRLRRIQGRTSDEVWLLYFSRDGSL
jgi:ligand-binding sensor domain-containing protein